MTFSYAQLQQLWIKYGGNPRAAPMAAAIAMAESSGRSDASNSNTNGSIDRGLWQINSIHGSQSTFDIPGNVRAAIAISNNGASWTPWTTFNTGAYRQYLGKAASASLPASLGGSSSKPGSPPSRSNPSYGFSTQLSTSGGTTNTTGAFEDALLQGASQPIDLSGKIKGDDLLGRVVSNINSGAYTTPFSSSLSINSFQNPSNSAHGNSGSSPSMAGFSGYINPISGAALGRTDMGLDASGLSNGHAIRAIGDSKVVGISPNWFRGQPYVLFQFLDGPQKGKYYYIAEAINPTVHAGETVRRGQVVGTYNAGGTGLELGWGSSTPGRTQAQATTGYTEGQVTPAGVSFTNFFKSLR